MGKKVAACPYSSKHLPEASPHVRAIVSESWALRSMTATGWVLGREAEAQSLPPLSWPREPHANLRQRLGQQPEAEALTLWAWGRQERSP